MSTNVHERFVGLDGDAFAQLVARTWRGYGWQVVESPPAELPERIDDPTAPITDGVALLVKAARERVLLTVPGAEALSAPTLLGVLSTVGSPSELLVVAAAGFDTGTLSVADAYGVEVVGPATLARLRDSAVDADPPEQ